MAQRCSLLDDCGFLKKYQATEQMACKWFIQEYCNGARMAECRRRQHLEQHGTRPSDDTTPTDGTSTVQCK